MVDEGWQDRTVLAIKEDVLVTMAGCKLGWPPLTASGMKQSPVLGREEAHSIVYKPNLYITWTWISILLYTVCITSSQALQTLYSVFIHDP